MPALSDQPWTSRPSPCRTSSTGSSSAWPVFPTPSPQVWSNGWLRCCSSDMLTLVVTRRIARTFIVLRGWA